MKIHLTILLTVHFLSLLSISNSSKPQTPNSIRDLLQSKGLPHGLFPSSIKSYRVDQDGQLEVWFDRPCFSTFEGDFRFEMVVRGNLRYGGLAGVEGISQQELFLMSVAKFGVGGRVFLGFTRMDWEWVAEFVKGMTKSVAALTVVLMEMALSYFQNLVS